MKKLFSLPLFFILLVSCSKKENNSGILLRVENNTSVPIMHISAVSTDYGDLQTSAFSDYKYFDEVVAFPGATFSIYGKEAVYAGNLYCGTPPLPYLQEGKYTLRIYEDTSMYSGYNAVFEKE